MDIYIGVDLAWGEKNLSGFCVLGAVANTNSLQLLDLKLLQSIDAIVGEIQKYKQHKVYVGIDAPLLVPNETANREIEKNFNKDFAKYKISMLPANRKILSKYSPKIRSEELYKQLTNLGYKREYTNDKVVFEVYPHATIAMLFNKHQILPYKRKKGRSTEFIKEQLQIYQKYVSKVIVPHPALKEDIKSYKGQKLKDYEDMLDSVTSAYTVYYCRFNEARLYQLNGEDTFVTPLSPWKVYMLRCADDTLYTGVTTDLQRRVQEHNTSSLGAKYTKVRRPVELVYFESCDDRVDATKREYAIKQLSRKEKLELLNV